MTMKSKSLLFSLSVSNCANHVYIDRNGIGAPLGSMPEGGTEAEDDDEAHSDAGDIPRPLSNISQSQNQHTQLDQPESEVQNRSTGLAQNNIHKLDNRPTLSPRVLERRGDSDACEPSAAYRGGSRTRGSNKAHFSPYASSASSRRLNAGRSGRGGLEKSLALYFDQDERKARDQDDHMSYFYS